MWKGVMAKMYQISRVLRLARAMAGVSRIAMAKKLGMSRSHYAKLEAGLVIAGRNVLRKVARTVDMSSEAIWMLNATAPKELNHEQRGQFEEMKSSLLAEFVMNDIFKEKGGRK